MSSPLLTSLQPSVDANFPIFGCAAGSLSAALDTCPPSLDEISGRTVGGTAEAQFLDDGGEVAQPTRYARRSAVGASAYQQEANRSWRQHPAWRTIDA